MTMAKAKPSSFYIYLTQKTLKIMKRLGYGHVLYTNGMAK